MTLIKWFMACLFIVGASACNTMEGLGEDIEAGGQKLEDAAERKKKE